jgi:3-hydroxymyristoyl/3-hydroxydecanoyl-(acyl carrier protein) dehydratase
MISHEVLKPQNNRIITEVTLKNVVETKEVLLIKLDGKCYTADGTLLVEGTDLHFGFFSQESLKSNTAGITMKEADKKQLAEMRQNTMTVPPSEMPDPTLIGTRLALPRFPGLCFDRICEFRPQGGKAGLGYLRVEKDVNPAEWIFYSHFYMDPVVPGSYSLDACMQVLEYYLLYHKLDETMPGQANLHFAPNHQQWMNWVYKGQILQTNSIITYEVEITDLVKYPQPCATGHARVYVDGRFIYEIFDYSVKITE